MSGLALASKDRLVQWDPQGPVGERGPKGDAGTSNLDIRPLEKRVADLENRLKERSSSTSGNALGKSATVENERPPDGCHFISERGDFVLRVRGGDSICFDGKVVATIQATGIANYYAFVDYNVIGKGRVHCREASGPCVIETVPGYGFTVLRRPVQYE